MKTRPTQVPTVGRKIGIIDDRDVVDWISAFS